MWLLQLIQLLLTVLPFVVNGQNVDRSQSAFPREWFFQPQQQQFAPQQFAPQQFAQQQFAPQQFPPRQEQFRFVMVEDPPRSQPQQQFQPQFNPQSQFQPQPQFQTQLAESQIPRETIFEEDLPRRPFHFHAAPRAHHLPGLSTPRPRRLPPPILLNEQFELTVNIADHLEIPSNRRVAERLLRRRIQAASSPEDRPLSRRPPNAGRMNPGRRPRPFNENIPPPPPQFLPPEQVREALRVASARAHATRRPQMAKNIGVKTIATTEPPPRSLTGPFSASTVLPKTTRPIPQNVPLNANDVFLQCCKDHHVDRSCESRCNFDALNKKVLTGMFLGSDPCPRNNGGDLMVCAAQQKDHTQCCIERGVDLTSAGDKCLGFCQMAPGSNFQADVSMLPCWAVLRDIKSCFKDSILHDLR